MAGYANWADGMGAVSGSGVGVMDVLSGIGSGAMGWLSDGKNLQGLGTLVSGVGGAWAGLEQAKQSKALLNLQKSAYDDEKKRRDAAQLAINSAWSTTPTPMASLPLGGA